MTFVTATTSALCFDPSLATERCDTGVFCIVTKCKLYGRVPN